MGSTCQKFHYFYKNFFGIFLLGEWCHADIINGALLPVGHEFVEFGRDSTREWAFGVRTGAHDQMVAAPPRYGRRSKHTASSRGGRRRCTVNYPPAANWVKWMAWEDAHAHLDHVGMLGEAWGGFTATKSSSTSVGRTWRRPRILQLPSSTARGTPPGWRGRHGSPPRMLHTARHGRSWRHKTEVRRARVSSWLRNWGRKRSMVAGGGGGPLIGGIGRFLEAVGRGRSSRTAKHATAPVVFVARLKTTSGDFRKTPLGFQEMTKTVQASPWFLF